jgi:DNA-directed RNA polymerase specialized sigma24 family protein
MEAVWDDLRQEALVGLWESAGKPRAYREKVMLSRMVDWYRTWRPGARKMSPPRFLPVADLIDDVTPEAVIGERERAVRALERLTPRGERLAILRALGYTNREAAAEIGVSEGHASQLSRGLRQMGTERRWTSASEGEGRERVDPTHCVNGHPREPGRRKCRACARERTRRWRARKR